ncbi:hypothetical protein [Andreprevotia lacus]|jgi:hypothetical protein|uniref:hypothetical protein n=1 Tax=Andreprevotia lacus TaxID=1121000 RepID=UPI001592E87A|nr:hypothetical protein [Andreprevotia lacus]
MQAREGFTRGPKLGAFSANHAHEKARQCRAVFGFLLQVATKKYSRKLFRQEKLR